ncbi:Peptidase M15A [Dethiosulfovibrio peptidovorans DSM 11002]|uniref:Peptidase M15A n=1 Tax=Dethiosulfovibrio peptidovorans DSM 11002 TaxID=469381 RepID=D2Z5U3_9BACT|nr:D-Ala-D-Ala carboxypeptidase family metallohydrolase [Dethiosulfovibrio peptidovorans]EFC90840.1 Peptidase M15A [Dethiosulfovibrio peptidovorans DSM 11002]
MDDNDIRIAPHFSLREFQCPCCLTVRLQPELLSRLEALRGRWGPLRITSGYRCPRHNSEVGGVPRSRHMKGAAADVVVSRNRQELFCAVAREEGFESILPYRDRGFVHLAV